MGVPSTSFVDTFNPSVTDLMVKLVEYMQDIDKYLTPPLGPRDGTSTDDISLIPLIQKLITLEKSDNRFPILPDPIPSVGWKKTTWDSLFTDYLGQQYSLACGGRKRHIPYKHISVKQQDFIENKYLPHKTRFSCPRNITMPEIKSIFDYFIECQRTHGPEDTFKFKSIKFNGKTIPAKYETNNSS